MMGTFINWDGLIVSVAGSAVDEPDARPFSVFISRLWDLGGPSSLRNASSGCGL